jgi:hypothetical protein
MRGSAQTQLLPPVGDVATAATLYAFGFVLGPFRIDGC